MVIKDHSRPLTTDLKEEGCKKKKEDRFREKGERK